MSHNQHPRKTTPAAPDPFEALQRAIDSMAEFKAIHESLLNGGDHKQIPASYWENLRRTKDSLLDCERELKNANAPIEYLEGLQGLMDEIGSIEQKAKSLSQKL